MKPSGTPSGSGASIILATIRPKYVVERVRRWLTLQPLHTRSRTVARLEQSEVQRLIQTTYRSRSKYGLMFKTLFQTGARVDEFVQHPRRGSASGG
jgi:hypothetical protein